MTKVKAVIRRSATNRNGKCSVKIRLFKGQNSKEVTIPRSLIFPSQWDSVRSLVKDDKMLNHRIKHEIAQYEAIINKLEILGKSYTLNDVVRASVREDSRSFEEQFNPDMLLATFLDQNFINNQLLSYGTRKNYKSFKKMMKEYFGVVRLFDLDQEMLDQLVYKLRSTGSYSDWTIHSKVKYFKRVVNMCIETALIPPERKLYYKVPKGTTSRKPLNQQEMTMLSGYNPSTDKDAEILNAFKFACFTGMRFGDICVLQYTSITKDPYSGDLILSYKMRKSGNNVELVLPNYAASLLDKDKLGFSFRVFNLLNCKTLPNDSDKTSKMIESANAYVNKRLKVIFKNAGVLRKFSFHESRYTFLCTGIELGIDYLTLKELGGLKSVDVLETHYAKVSKKAKKIAVDRYNTLNI